MKRMIRNTLDFRLLKNTQFTLCLLGTVFGAYHSLSMLTHFPNRAVSLGLSRTEAAQLMSFASICITISRVFTMIVGNCIQGNRIIMMTAGHAFDGLADVLMLAIPGYYGCLAGAICFGTATGMYNTLLTVVIVDLLGIDQLPRGLALVLFSQSFSLLLAAPVTGALYDVTKSYDVPLYVTLTTAVICVCLLSLVLLYKKLCLTCSKI